MYQREDIGMPRIEEFEAEKIGLIIDASTYFNPIDLCMDCYRLFNCYTDVEHPDYDDNDYNCLSCGHVLCFDLDN
jgi:hypothetical protein